MSNFSYKHCPKDLFQENYKPELRECLFGDNTLQIGKEGPFRHPTNFAEAKEEILKKFLETSYPPQHYRYDEHPELNFTSFKSKSHCDNTFSVAYHQYPRHAASGLDFYPPYHRVDSVKDYDRISQIWAASSANMGELRNNFREDYKDIGSNLRRTMNSILVEKDKTHIFGDDADHFSFGNNATGLFFEDFTHYNDTYAENLTQKFYALETQKQPVQNSFIAAETGKNYRHTNCCNYGEQLKAELLQIISSLTASIGRLEIQVEHLSHKVQDMANKISDENNKFSAQILDHSGDSKVVLEESKATANKFFSVAADSGQKSDEDGWIDDCDASTSDWEII